MVPVVTAYTLDEVSQRSQYRPCWIFLDIGGELRGMRVGGKNKVGTRFVGQRNGLENLRWTAIR